MKLVKKMRPPVEPRSFGSGLIVGCFLVSMTYSMMSKNQIVNCLPSSPSLSSSWLSGAAPMSSMLENNRRIQLSGHEKAEQVNKPERNEAVKMHGNSSSTSSASDVHSGEEDFPSTDNKPDGKEEEGISSSCESNSGNCKMENDRELLARPSTSDSNESDGPPKRKSMCDLSGSRVDMCDVDGDIRIIGKNLSSVMVVAPHSSDRNQSWQIKPYPRKYDYSAMAKVRALTLKSLHGAQEAPRCTINHTVPGILFSTGGHCGNCFHDFADVLIPLFQTASPFQGRVQFIITQHQGWWMNKYRRYLLQLSSYDVIDFDTDERVHCFERVILGLQAERDLMIDPSASPNYSTMDFVKLTRSVYSLGRDRPWMQQQQPGKKPRLLFIARGGTRKFTNLEEIVPMAEEVGYEVVVSEPDFFDVAGFARIVNSCDVMVGVHGAGLTNFLFLPTDAVVIQVVPLGNLDWIATNFYAEPAMGVKLRYLQYNITVEESTLSELYPRDHQVFKDPESIHRQGWSKLGGIYLKQQNVRLDVKRFRSVLVKALELLHEEN